VAGEGENSDLICEEGYHFGDVEEDFE